MHTMIVQQFYLFLQEVYIKMALCCKAPSKRTICVWYVKTCDEGCPQNYPFKSTSNSIQSTYFEWTDSKRIRERERKRERERERERERGRQRNQEIEVNSTQVVYKEDSVINYFAFA